MKHIISGISRTSNDYMSTHMHWNCWICKEDIRVKIDCTPVQFTFVACKRCHREYELHNYLTYSN